MTGSRLVCLLIFLLLSSFICTLGMNAWATTNDSEYPYLTEGKVLVSEDFYGYRIIDSAAINATDYYTIYSTFSNPTDKPTSFLNIFYVAVVIDQDGYATFIDLNTYGNQTVMGRESKDYSIFWVPIVPGEYTIRTFLISDFDNPQIASSVATLHVKVKEKIDMLGEGESNYRLQVESISVADNTVTVVYNFCNETYPYSHRAEVTLNVGDHVSINSVDAYFLGIEEGKAIFIFEANGGEFPEACLV